MLLSDLKACLSSGFRSEVFITFLKLGTPDYAVTFPFRCFLASNQVATQSSAFPDESYILFQYTFGAKSFNNARFVAVEYSLCWNLSSHMVVLTMNRFLQSIYYYYYSDFYSPYVVIILTTVVVVMPKLKHSFNSQIACIVFKKLFYKAFVYGKAIMI